MSKLLFLVFGLVALSCAIEAKSFLKKFHQKALISSHAEKGEEAVKTLLRKRREVEETTASPEITDEEAKALMKFFMAAAWESDKVDVLSDFIEEMTDHETNLTLIGWQRIYDDQGHVKQINTVQLVIPPKPESEHDHHVDDDDEDEDDEDDKALPHGKINELKEIFEPMAILGIPASITMEEFDKKGEHEVLIYMDKDELYVKDEGFAIYNKTAEVPQQEVESFIKNLKPTILGEPSVLRYDVDGHLQVEKSTIKPHLLGSVIDHYEAPGNILVEGPGVIARISQQFPQEQIPKELAGHFNKAYPEYNWRVLVDPVHYYITRDVSITLAYDNFDLDETSDISYFVYGVKKEKTN